MCCKCIKTPLLSQAASFRTEDGVQLSCSSGSWTGHISFIHFRWIGAWSWSGLRGAGVCHRLSTSMGVEIMQNMIATVIYFFLNSSNQKLKTYRINVTVGVQVWCKSFSREAPRVWINRDTGGTLHSSSHCPQFVALGEGWNIVCLVNWELCLWAQFSFHWNGQDTLSVQNCSIFHHFFITKIRSYSNSSTHR